MRTYVIGQRGIKHSEARGLARYSIRPLERTTQKRLIFFWLLRTDIPT